MYFRTAPIKISLALIVLSSCTLTTGEDDKKHIMIQKLHEHKYSHNSTWPLFNDSSYVYLLGLFIKQRTLMMRHYQTLAEPNMFRAAILLSQKYNMTVNGKQFAYRMEDTSGRDVIETLERTCQAVQENQVLGIVGPEYSAEAKTIARFANRVHLPVVGYSTTDPELSNRNAYQTFYRLPPSDIITAQVLLKLFEKYKWNATNVIYQSDNYGEGGMKALIEVFNNKIKIKRAIKYDLYADRIDNLKSQLEESSSRCVIVWAHSEVTIKIIELAIKTGGILAPSFLWIFLAPNSTMQITHYGHANQLGGMLILRPVTPDLFSIPTNKSLLNDTLRIWRDYEPDSYYDDEKQIDIFALYAFDAACLLMLAIQKFHDEYPNTSLDLMHTSSCFGRQLIHGNELNHIIQTMNFTGVSGYVQFQSNTTDRIDSKIAYYVIDNLQPSTVDSKQLQVVEVLKFDGITSGMEKDNNSQWIEAGSPIRWPDNSSKPPTYYALLKDKTLNITVYISAPFFMVEFDAQNRSHISGYIPELVSLPKERMGFEYNFKIAPIEVSYDELVDCVANHTYEIVMADLSITSNRSAKIAFSHPIYDNTIRLVIRKSHGITISPFSFLKPFSYQLWLLILFVIYFGSALLIGCYEYRYKRRAGTPESVQNGDIQHSKILITMIRSLYHTIGALVQRGSELQPKSFFGRLQTVIVWLMSVILVALLTSNLTTYFTVQREKPWIQSIDDIQTCRKVDCKRIGIVDGSQHAEFFKNEIMNGRDVPYYHLKHPNDSYKKLMEHAIDVAITDSSTADYFTQTPDYCQLEVITTTLGKSYFGIAFPQEWPYENDLDRHIIELKSNGEIDRLLAKWFQRENCDDENKSFPGHGLQFYETSGLFIIFGTLTSLNFIVFLFKSFSLTSTTECLSSRKCSKKKRSRKNRPKKIPSNNSSINTISQDF